MKKSVYGAFFLLIFLPVLLTFYHVNRAVISSNPTGHPSFWILFLLAPLSPFLALFFSNYLKKHFKTLLPDADLFHARLLLGFSLISLLANSASVLSLKFSGSKGIAEISLLVGLLGGGYFLTRIKP